MFPTGVGMNRPMWGLARLTMYVPHRRGDEPSEIAVIGSRLICSPQAWG